MSTTIIYENARRLCRIAAQDVFDIDDLYPRQLDVMVRLYMMKVKVSPIEPAPLLFVKPTGGGKSLVRDVNSVMFRGVALTIVPILALGADQSVNVRTNANQLCGDVLSLHIDEVRDEGQTKQIVKLIKDLPQDTEKLSYCLRRLRQLLIISYGGV